MIKQDFLKEDGHCVSTDKAEEIKGIEGKNELNERSEVEEEMKGRGSRMK